MDYRVHHEETILDELLHPIDIHDEYARFVLCYPYDKCNEDLINYRIKILKKIGLEYLVETGSLISGYRILGKGYSSIVVKSYYHGKPVVLKIRRLDSRRKTLEYEGMILDYLSPLPFLPQIYFWSRDILVMEYINCPGIVEAIRKANKESVNTIIKRAFTSLYLLDLLGIDHGELNRPYNHVFLCNSGIIKIIDWESARPRAKPHNLTMFASYIFFRSGLFLLSNYEKNIVLNILRNYKFNPTIYLRKLLNFLSSHEFSRISNTH